MEPVTFLTIGDPHFKLDNILETRDLLEQSNYYLNHNKVDFIVCLGDLLHTHEKINTTPMNEALKFIKMLATKAPTFILVGNHDMINQLQFLSENHWMNCMKPWENVTVVDKGHVHSVKGNKFMMVPYVYPGRFKEALEVIDSRWNKEPSIVFAHQEFKGAKMGGIVSTEGDDWGTELPYVISGHIHDKDQLQRNVLYVGSALQHSFGEGRKKALHLFTSLKGEVTHIEEVPIDTIHKKTVRVSFDSLKSLQGQLINTCFDQPKTNYRLVLEGNTTDYKLFQKTPEYKHLVEQKIKIILKPPESVTAETSQQKQLESLEDVFLSSLNEFEQTFWKEFTTST